MSLDKAIEHGKERRKKYFGAKAFDCTCRNHGSCERCRENRLYARKKSEQAAELKEVEENMLPEICSCGYRFVTDETICPNCGKKVEEDG